MDWEQREIAFPEWFAFGAESSIRARLKALSQPRQLHTVDLPIWQRDEARSRQIAKLDAGGYFKLIVRDPIAGIDIAESVMIMTVELLLGNGRTPIKRLVVIETGNPVEGNPLFLDNNPLFFGMWTTTRFS